MEVRKLRARRNAEAFVPIMAEVTHKHAAILGPHRIIDDLMVAYGEDRHGDGFS